MSTLITDNVNTGTIKSSGGTTAITIDSSGRVTEPQNHIFLLKMQADRM